jgi:hypothetical protein
VPEPIPTPEPLQAPIQPEEDVMPVVEVEEVVPEEVVTHKKRMEDMLWEMHKKHFADRTVSSKLTSTLKPTGLALI